MPVGYTPPPDIKPFHPIHEAAAAGDNDEILRLVAGGVDVDTEERYTRFIGGDYHSNTGFTPLHVAVKYGKIETASLLIDLGSDVYRVNGIQTWNEQSTSRKFHDNYMDAFSKTNGPLKTLTFVEMAINKSGGFGGNMEWIMLLKEKNVYFDGAMLSPFLGGKTPEELELLLSLGANVNHRATARYGTAGKDSANLFSVYRDDLDCIRILLSYGLNPDKRDFENYSYQRLQRQASSTSLRDYAIAQGIRGQAI